MMDHEADDPGSIPRSGRTTVLGGLNLNSLLVKRLIDNPSLGPVTGRN